MYMHNSAFMYDHISFIESTCLPKFGLTEVQFEAL